MIPINEWVRSAAEHCRQTGRPLVTLSYAQSLDGSLAARRGNPLALSGPQALRLTHQLRAAHDAILVGIGTVLADNPRLNVRLVEGESPQPVLLDSRLQLPLDANLLGGSRPLWIATTGRAPQERQAALQSAGARLLHFPADPRGRVPLPALLNCLADLGVNSLMVEGGAEVITAFLSQRLADRAVLTIAPVFVGGYPAVGQDGSLPYMPRLENWDFFRLGDDLIVKGQFA